MHLNHKDIKVNINANLFIALVLMAVLIINALKTSDALNHGYNGKILQSNNLNLKTNSFEIKVDKINWDTPATQMIPNSQNERIVSFNISIKNNSKVNLQFFPVIQSYIRDNEGDEYKMSYAQLKNPYPAGDIKPNQEVTGELSYLISKRDLPYTLYIDPGWSSYAPFAFRLN